MITSVKSLTIFLTLFFIMGCGGPKRGSINQGAEAVNGSSNEGSNTGSSSANGPSSTNPVTTSKAPDHNSPSGGPGSNPSAEPTPVATPAVRFSEVKPIFQKECFACHGNAAVANALGAPFVDWANDYQATKAYVDNGKLFERVWTLKDDLTKGMPQNGGTITDEERALIKKWIEGGGAE